VTGPGFKTWHTGYVALSLYGTLALVTGGEPFLAERGVAAFVAQALAEQPGAAVTTAAASDLTPALLDQMAGTDLFSSATVACITGAEKTPKAAEVVLIQLATNVPASLALIVAHAGGNQGKALHNRLHEAAGTITECPPIPARGLPKFVQQQVRAAGRTIGPEAAQALIDAVGQDLRSLAAAVSQLVSDTEGETITTSVVNRYFAGRATITAYSVSDDAVAGKTGEAIAKLRWALATGVAHVLITSTLAASIRQLGLYLAISRQHPPSAEEVGAPGWKMKEIAAGASAWSERSIAGAIRAISLADAQIKGAAQDPDFALERLIIRLAALRRSSHAPRGA